MIELAGVFARTTIRSSRVLLEDVNLEASRGVLAILGNELDGTSLLLDILDGTIKPKRGNVIVLDGKPGQSPSKIARVSALAPLPEALTVDEVCALESELRGGPARPASERLATLGIELLRARLVRSLSFAERRAVALALALTSNAQLLLVEEPLVAIEPVAYKLVIDALRARAAASCVVVTTASPRDAMRVADRLGVLTRGKYSPLDPKRGSPIASEGRASMRIVVAHSAGRAGAAAIAAALGVSDVVTHLEVSAYAPTSEAMAIFVSGSNLAELSRVVTRAIASARVDVELVEPTALSLDAIRAAVAPRVEGQA